MLGQYVTYQSKLWRSLVDNNTVTPAEGANWTVALAATAGIPPFSVPGPLAVQTWPLRLYVTQACTITGVRASVGTAPTGASLIVDVNKNGTTLFTTQSARPTIVVGTNTVTTVPAVTALAVGDYLTVDIDQVGSTVAGSFLTVQVATS
jgi:hypothetical protein